jgi:hypothetical protein
MNTSSHDVTASAARERRSQAHKPVSELDDLAWAAAAWLHAHELRRCIDGRVLTLLRARLGETAFAVLRCVSSPADAAGRTPPALDLAAMPAPQLDALLLSLGRDCLLASVEPPSLRRCLREHWWPAASGPVQAPSTAVARAAVQAAMDHRHAGRAASSSSPAP